MSIWDVLGKSGSSGDVGIWKTLGKSSSPQGDTSSTPDTSIDNTPPIETPKVNLGVLATPAPNPYLATTDKFGRPNYGDGFQGWARKTFATLFAPTNYSFDATEQSKQFYQKEVTGISGAMDKNLNWQAWGQKITGLSSQDVAQGLAAAPAALKQAEVQGKNVQGEAISQATGLAARTPAALWDTFTRVVGTTDFLARKVYSFGAGVETALDSAYVDRKPQTDNPILQGIEKTAESMSSITNIVGNTGSLAIAIATKKISFEKAKGIVDTNMAGSAMLYSSLVDESKKVEFANRYKAGEDPNMLSEELQNSWVELAGSIIGDPLTWEGAGVVGDFGKASTTLKIPILGKDIVVGGKTLSVPWRVVSHLPTFGDALAVVGIKIGAARRVDEVSKFTESVAKGFGEDIKAASQSVDAQKAVMEASQKAAQNIASYAKNFSAVALDSKGKATTIGRDASHVLYNLVSYSKDNEETFQVLNQYHILNDVASSPAEKALASATLMSHPLGQVLTSEKGIQTGYFLDKLYADGKIQTIIDAAGGDRVKLAKNLFEHFDTVLHSTFASIDDMHNASEAVKSVGKPGAKAVDEATMELAKRYEDLKKTNPLEVAVRNVTRQVDKVNNPIVGTMGNIYIRYNPAFFAKNIQGQSLRIMMEMGLGQGADIAGKAIGSANKDYAEWLLGMHQQESQNLLGYLHEGLNRGFGSSLGVAESAANRAEGATSGEIIIRTIRDEIGKALNNGAIPLQQADALDKALPGARDILISNLKKYDGNQQKAVSALRDIFATGHLEASQAIEIPENVKNFLADNHQLERVMEIQQNTKGLSREEVVSEFSKVVEDMRGKAVDALNSVPAVIGDNAMKQTPDVAEAALEAQQLHADGVLPFETSNGFTKMTQGWANAQDAMDKMVMSGIQKLAPGLSETENAQLLDAVNSAHQTRDSLSRIKTVRDKVRMIYEEAKLNKSPVSDLAKRANVGEMFDLMKAYPEADFTTMSTKEFKNVLWQEFYNWSGKDYHESNILQYNQRMSALETGTKVSGGTLADLMAPKEGQMSLFEIAQKKLGDAEKYQQEYFDPAMALQSTLSKIPKSTTLQDAVIPEFGRFSGGKTHLFNAVNADRAAKGIEPAASMADVTKEEWAASYIKRLQVNQAPTELRASADALETKLMQAKTKPEADAIREELSKIHEQLAPSSVGKPTPPPFAGENIKQARGIYENMDGFETEYKTYVDSISKSFGQVLPVGGMTPEAERALSDFSKAYEGRMAVVRTAASATATAKRDFLLHSYDKTYLDHALAYLSPFHYWTDRTYVRTMEQLVENPGFLASGAKYKDFIEKQHAGLPNWWKYNVQVPDLLGADPSHPLFMNLQAGLDPMNGLTGVDFNDPYKRTDWISKSVDDLNKFGPTFTPLIQYAVGLNLYRQGQVDAGERWFGRLLPQTAYAKSALTVAQNLTSKITGKSPQMANLGPFVQNNEVDPFVNFLDGGLDPYERARVGRALGSLQSQGIPKEQLLDAARTQQGPLWDQAVHLALTYRAPGQLMSAVLGINAKPRTEQDIQTDQMYGELNHLYSLAGTVSPQDYKSGFDQLNQKYPFMDIVLLSKRGGPERDASFAYNVLSRIQPGQATSILKTAGLPQDLINKFYDSKGFTDTTVKFTPNEQSRFMNSILDLSAILKIPSNPTQQEWTAAKSTYQQIDPQLQKQFGTDILDKINAYYQIKDSNPAQAADFKDNHPEIDAALRAKQGLILATPILSKYYGGIDTVESYYDGKARQDLITKYGQDILAKQQAYFDEMDPKARKAILQKYPELSKYWSDSSAMQDQTNRNIVAFASKLPQGQGSGIRPDFTAENNTQQALAASLAATGQQVPSWQDLSKPMSASLQNYVINYWTNGTPLSKNATTELDYLAKKQGLYDGQELLRYAGIAMQQQP